MTPLAMPALTCVTAGEWLAREVVSKDADMTGESPK